jgi:hypothetical protein
MEQNMNKNQSAPSQILQRRRPLRQYRWRSHMFLVSAFARLEAFAEGEAQSMFLAAASPRRSASHSFPEMDFF